MMIIMIIIIIIIIAVIACIFPNRQNSLMFNVKSSNVTQK
jgi:hypothetical protein